MNTTTRTLIAIPLAAAALSAGATAATAQPAGPVLSDFDQAQPDPGPQDGPDDKAGPNDDPGPQDGPDDKAGPDNDDGPDVPDDKDGPDNDDGPDIPDDFDGPGHGGDDSDDSDDDSDDSDHSDDDSDDSDHSDDSDNDVKRPTRVDAGGTDGGLSLAWLLGSGAMVTAAGGFTARRAALKRR